jgi:hypothetical protein
MRVVRAMLAILAAGLGASSCQAPRATFERTFFDPAKPYVGMTKEQVIACAGAPAGRYNTNTGETLVYHYSGAGPVPTAAPKKQDDAKANPFGSKKSDKNYDCNAKEVASRG